MSAPALSALTAAAATGVVLTARRAAARRRRGTGSARVAGPLRRRAARAPAPAGVVPAEASWDAVRRAEEHVQRCWRQLAAGHEG